MCELLVNVLGIEDARDTELRVHVECRAAKAFCESCLLAT
jgi:hypothetical protein